MPWSLTVVYVGYRIVRGIYLFLFAPRRARPWQRPTLSMPRQAAVSRAAGPPPAPVFVVKPRLVRLRELIGSLLISAAVAAAMCAVMELIVAHAYRAAVQPEQCAWLFLTSLAGAWIVLVTGKCWEGSDGEPLLRRFILMSLGLALGLAAGAVADVFLVRLLPDAAFTISTNLDMPPSFYHDGQPLPMAFMAVFAALFALVRWWRQADPMRGARLSLGPLIVTVIGAHIVATILQFPEPWLMMIAGCMSVSVQLASPWVPTHARLKPQRKKVI